jgi:hypothetical protein
MSSKTIKPSSTFVTTSDSVWVGTILQPPSIKGSTSVQNDPYVVMLTGRTQIGLGGAAEIVTSIEPTTVSKKLAIRRLNDEMEGRVIPTETYASKTAG